MRGKNAPEAKVTSRQFSTDLLVAVRELRARGRKTLRLEHLEDVLAKGVDGNAATDDAAIERFKAELQQWNDNQQRSHEIDMENFKVVIASGQAAIKTMLLINGGAAVALLAYLGNIAGGSSADVNPFATAMLPFGVGVLLAGATSGLTYLTQFFYAGDKGWLRILGHFTNGLAILVGAAGFLAFGLGIWWTYLALVGRLF